MLWTFPLYVAPECVEVLVLYSVIMLLNYPIILLHVPYVYRVAFPSNDVL